MRKFSRVLVGLLAFLLITGSTALLAPSASARGFTVRYATYDCGWTSCSVYISRSGTKKLKNELKWKDAAGGGATAVCAALALPTIGVGSVPCGVIAGVGFGSATVVAEFAKEAVDGHPPKGACLRFVKPYVGPGFIRTDNGKHCKD